jgi:hypothetical protein
LPTAGRLNSEQGSDNTGGRVSYSDFEAALIGLSSMADPDGVEARNEILRRWAEADPSAAAAWAAKLPQGSICDEALQQVIVTWGKADLPSSTRWLAILPERECKWAATISLGYGAARVAPQAALRPAATLSTSIETDNLLVYATSQWASADAQSALGGPATFLTRVYDSD